MEEDKYYYFPTMTKNIALVRGEKYYIKDKLYTLIDFTNNSWHSPITFEDENYNMLQIGAMDIGSVISLKEKRKYKLQRINKLNNV